MSWLVFPAGLALWFFLLFPDGRLQSPRWRRFAWFATGVLALGFVRLSETGDLRKSILDDVVGEIVRQLVPCLQIPEPDPSAVRLQRVRHFVDEHAPQELGMTPATYSRGGRGTNITYTIVASPLGQLLVAVTERGVCAVRMGDTDADVEKDLRAEFPAATIQRDDAALREPVKKILNHLTNKEPQLALPLDIRSTAFQRQVWEQLRAIPYGSTVSYGEVAKALGKPGAVRAVGRACATNPVALVIPCHRVVREDQSLGGYRWGLERKQKLIDRERKNN